MTAVRLAIALSLVIWTQLAMAQSSPKAGMLDPEAWVQRSLPDFQASLTQ